jgi:hypothetical protein
MTIGMAERSKKTRKLSVAFPNEHIDWMEAEAKRRGCSAAKIVREAVAKNRADLSADLVRAALEEAAEYIDDFPCHTPDGFKNPDQRAWCYGVQMEFRKSLALAIKNRADDPEAIAAIVTKVTEGKS